MLQWGNRWASPDGAPVELVHVDCGETVTAQIRCADDHAVEIGDLQLQPAPAFVTSSADRSLGVGPKADQDEIEL